MSRIVNINKYGWPLVAWPVPDEAWHWYEQFYIVDETTQNTKYMCFADTEERVIWRETKNQGVTTLEFSWGKWSDKTNLTYHPIHGSCPVTVNN